MAAPRVHGSSHPVGQPVVRGEGGSIGNVDPNTVVEGARDRFEEVADPGLNRLAALPHVVDSRFAERGDVVGKRLIAQVLVCALGMTMAQIDEPGAKENDAATPLRRS